MASYNMTSITKKQHHSQNYNAAPNYESPLIDYLEKKNDEEYVAQNNKNQISNLRKFYLTNFFLLFLIISSIYFMFYVQFRVDKMQEKVDLVQAKINEYNDEIKLLDVEWSYLTRPERLRFLSSQYLQNDKIIALDQIKTYDKLQQLYAENNRIESAKN